MITIYFYQFEYVFTKSSMQVTDSGSYSIQVRSHACSFIQFLSVIITDSQQFNLSVKTELFLIDTQMKLIQ